MPLQKHSRKVTIMRIAVISDVHGNLTAPIPHVMEAGSPHARYGLLDRGKAGWSAQLCAVPYDYEAAALEAERNGRPDAAYSLRTGRMAMR
jgi:hypothetical protein